MLGRAGMLLGAKGETPFFQNVDLATFGASTSNLSNKASYTIDPYVSGALPINSALHPWNNIFGRYTTSPIALILSWMAPATIDRVALQRVIQEGRVGNIGIDYWTGSAWAQIGQTIAEQTWTTLYGWFNLGGVFTTDLRLRFSGMYSAYNDMGFEQLRVYGADGGAFTAYATADDILVDNLGRTATWSSPYGSGGNQVSDGSNATYWLRTPQALPHYVDGVWGSAQTIKRFELHNQYGPSYPTIHLGPMAWKVQAWDNDLSQWYEIARFSQTANTTGVTLDNAVSTLKIRFEAMDAGNTSYYTVPEIQMFSS